MKDFENKYILKNSDAPKLLDILMSRCPLDSEYPKAQIVSLYFDTPDKKLLKEKINSDLIKTKYRVRWYRDFNTKLATGKPFLEVKGKLGEVRNKYRKQMDISSQEFEQLGYQDSFFSLVTEELMSLKPYSFPLFPFMLISYQRVRFKVPGTQIRFCLDFNIHVPKINEQFGITTKPYMLKEAVFEIKGPEEDLPEFMKIIETLGGRRDSFSKYLACYQMIKNTKE